MTPLGARNDTPPVGALGIIRPLGGDRAMTPPREKWNREGVRLSRFGCLPNPTGLHKAVDYANDCPAGLVCMLHEVFIRRETGSLAIAQTGQGKENARLVVGAV